MKSKIKQILVIAACLVVVMVSSAHAQRMVIAIKKFENEANAPADLFNTLRSRITDNIINTRKFEVVERQRLKSALSEQKLANAGLTSEESAPEAGNLKGAGYVIYGSVLSLGIDATAANAGGIQAAKLTSKVELQLRFTDAETGEIVASKTIIATKSQSRMGGDGLATAGNVEEQVIQDSIREASKKVTQALMDLAFPAKVLKVSGGSVMINLPQEATEIGAVYEVWDVGEELIDPDTGESLGAEEELLGEVRVERTKPKFCLAKPIGDLDLDFVSPGAIVRRIDEDIVKARAAEAKAEAKENFKSRF